ncbi:MAG TPA: tRNA uridine-5-carboxymethylaminomethyl(34) synthesis GTPase MnmE [Pyrinomonadaceae bacterium]
MSTIVALSTPKGRGAIGVIRLSGPLSPPIANALTGVSSGFEPRKATLAHVLDQNGTVLDEVIVTYFKSPQSLTGEDVVEIACHGSPAVIRQIIDASLDLGARLAGPGEFTLRAVANRKINLAEAEAIRDLIESQTQAAAKQAARQLNGELSKTLDPLKKSLVEVIVVLESALEFVEDDLPPAEANALVDQLVQVVHRLELLESSYAKGQLLHDGVRIAITGPPNVGKSSLFNMLVTRDRAIVTDVPGTTRDTLTEALDIGGIPVVLTDTAGLRDTSDDIEALGIARTHQAMSDADLVLFVLDGSVQPGPTEQKLISRCDEGRRLLIINKCDLPNYSFPTGDAIESECIRISARTGEGLPQLHGAILEVFDSGSLDADGLLITNARHHELLCRAKREIDSAVELLRERRSEELVLAPLHNSLKLLGEITGETTTEDILSQIFATFCIGK